MKRYKVKLKAWKIHFWFEVVGKCLRLLKQKNLNVWGKKSSLTSDHNRHSLPNLLFRTCRNVNFKRYQAFTSWDKESLLWHLSEYICIGIRGTSVLWHFSTVVITVFTSIILTCMLHCHIFNAIISYHPTTTWLILNTQNRKQKESCFLLHLKIFYFSYWKFGHIILQNSSKLMYEYRPRNKSCLCTNLSL